MFWTYKNVGNPKAANVSSYLYHVPKSCSLHIIRFLKSLSWVFMILCSQFMGKRRLLAFWTVSNEGCYKSAHGSITQEDEKSGSMCLYGDLKLVVLSYEFLFATET